MKNLGGKLFYFFSLFLPKVGGEVYQSWGEVYFNIMFSIGEPHRRKVWGASNVICPPPRPPAEYTTTQTAKPSLIMNNEKYTRSVSLRNVCDYPPPPPVDRVYAWIRKSTLGL